MFPVKDKKGLAFHVMTRLHEANDCNSNLESALDDE